MKLPKIETLIIVVFFGCVALWAMSKCSSERSDFTRRARDADEEEETAVRRDTPASRQAAPTPQTTLPLPAEQQQQPVNVQRPATTTTPVSTTAPARTPAATPATAPTTATTATAPAATANSKYSTLYVSIDGLKMRKEPGLKGEAVAKLALYEPVTFLNQKTEWTQQISLGYEKVTDHWVKVRTKSGKEGWVFGAGVHYYKMKRQGVME